MGENIVYLFIAFTILLCDCEIFSDMIKRKKHVIVKAYNKDLNQNVVWGILWVILIPLCFWLLAHSISHVKYLIKDRRYIKDIFHLFDMEYLKSLSNYFIKKEMFTESIDIIYFKSQFSKSILQLSLCSASAIVYFYRAFRKDKIHEGGISVSGADYTWDRVTAYEWGECETKKWFKKIDDYIELKITVKATKLAKKIFKKESEDIRMYIACEDKDKADAALITHNIGNV